MTLQELRHNYLRLTHTETIHDSIEAIDIYCELFIPAVVGISFTRSHPLQYHTDRRCWFAAKDVALRTNNI